MKSYAETELSQMAITENSDNEKLRENVERLTPLISDMLGQYLVDNHVLADAAINSVARASAIVLGNIIRETGGDTDILYVISKQFVKSLKDGYDGTKPMSVKFAHLQ